MTTETITTQLQQEQKQQRRYFVPDRSNPPRLRLTERDKELIGLVGTYRFLNSDQLVELYQLAHPQEEASARNLKHRLFLLFHRGYLQRHQQVRILRILEGKQLPFIYGIGPRARSILLERGWSDGEIKGALEQKTWRYLGHSLMITQFHITLAKALASQKDWRLKFWKNESRQTRDSFGERLRTGYEYSVNPDGYFGLKSPAGESYFFFLEADKATASPQRWQWKIQSYAEFWKRERHMRPKYGMPARTDDQGKTKPSAFRVLIVTTTEARKERLREMARQADPRGRGLNLFWFTTESAYLQDPTQLFASIWQLPSPQDPQDSKLSILTPKLK